MEDETRAINPSAASSQGDVVRADPDATVAPDRGTAAAPSPDPGMARAQIEKTRARMSETIDEIEDVLVRKKEQIQDRLDVLAPVRERPLASLGIVLGAGVVLGLLTGGDDDSRAEVHPRAVRLGGYDEDLEERAETWERRARRLMRIARMQEEELNALSSGRASLLSERWDDEDEVEEDREGAPSALDDFRDEIAERVTEFVTGALRGVFGGSKA